MTDFAVNPAPSRILIIKPSALGDIVHALPVLNLLRRKWPGAHIAWVVNGAFRSMLEGHPQLDEVIVFDRGRFGTGWYNPSAALKLHRFMRQLRQANFDLVIDLQGLFRSGWMAMRTRSSTRIGLSNAREFARVFYTQRIPVGSISHAVDRYLSACDAIGCGRAPVSFNFHVTDDDRKSVREMLGSTRAHAVLLPGTNWPTKRWPIAHFAALVRPLREKFGLQSVIAGGADVSSLAREIPDALDLTGRTNLRQLVALLEGASVVVANDSGPMHIASALNRPLVTMFGPTNHARTGPYGRMDTVVRIDIPCSPCYSRSCSHQSCMTWLTSDAVLNAVQQQLSAVG